MANKNTNNKVANAAAATNKTTSFNFDTEFEKKIKLSDGSEEYLYARGPKYSDDTWPLQCFLCRLGRILDEKFEDHLKSEKHVENLKKALKEPPNAEEFRQPYEQIYSDRMKNPIKIYPGETIAEVTTDYADRLIQIKEFNWDHPPAEGYVETLKPDIILEFNKKSPLLGLCYGFKMAKDKKIAYYCALCDAELTELNAYQHFNGKNHFNLYVEKHFPGTMEKISKFQGITDDQKAIIIRTIYQKLENWKGHRPFYLVNGKAFQSSKDRFLQRVRRIYHYCDTTIMFSENELKDIYEKIKRRQILVPPNPESLTKQPKTEKDMTKLPDDVEEKMPEKKESDERKSRKRKNKNSAVKDVKDVKNDDPKEKKAKQLKLKLDESPANWEKYRNLCQRAIQSLNTEYEKFSIVSERHPKYQEEWRRFYKNKSEMLQRERVNPNTYNFKPEWNDYWMRYLEHCFKKDADKCKFEFRKNLKLPYRGRTPEPPNVFEGCNFNSNMGQKSNATNNNLNTNASGIGGGTKLDSQNNMNNKQSGPVPLMSLGYGSIFGGNQVPTNNAGTKFVGENRGGSGGGDDVKIQVQSSLPVQQPQQQQRQSQSTMSQQQQLSQQKPQESEQQQQMQNQQRQQNVVNQNEDNNVPASVLSVLRLLTTLENELGSLGPTANQLLGKAILYEKESKLSANELLHETEFYSLFAISLEKLKGLLLAGLVPDLKIHVTKICVNDLEKILNLFEEYLRRNPDAAKNHIPSSVVLRKHQFSTSESNNMQPNSNNNMTNMSSNDNYNSRSHQNVGQNIKNADNNTNKWNTNQNSNNDKWNNNDGIRGANVGNQSGTNNMNYNRPNSQSGRGNGNNNNIQGGNIADRQRNDQNNEYNNNNRSAAIKSDFTQNSRNTVSNAGTIGQWVAGNFNRKSAGDYTSRNSGSNERSDSKVRSNDFYNRDLGNRYNQGERNDFYNNNQGNSGNRFNSMQKDLNNSNQNKFTQNYSRDTGSFNDQRGSNIKEDYNRNNGGNNENFNQRNSGLDFKNQRNSGNFGNNYGNVESSNQGNWNMNRSDNVSGGQHHSKPLPSLLGRDFGGNDNNYSSYGNMGGRGFGRR